MKNLLWLISLSVLLVLNTCSPETGAKSGTTDTVSAQDTSQNLPAIDQPDHADSGETDPGADADPVAADTSGGNPSGEGTTVHTHSSPNPEKLDSIKDAKTKGKFNK